MQQGEKHWGTKRIAGAVGGALLGGGFALLCPNVGLSAQGVACLGILLGAIVWWILDVLPAYATGIVMVVLFAVVGGVDSTVSLGAFRTGTWWLLVAAFGLGAGMKKSGLLRRMAVAIVRVFPNTFAAQVAGIMAAGTVLGPLVPSLSAKTSMLAPIAQNIGEALGYEANSKPMQGLFLAMYCGVRSVAPAALSASIIGYALLGLLPADVQAQFDMLHWFLAALPWFVLVTAFTYASILLLYRPRKNARAQGAGARDAATASAALAASATSASQAHCSAQAEAANTVVPIEHGKPSEQQTPMSACEKRMCAIILVTVALWMTEPLHHIAAHIVALAAFALTVACGILGPKGLREGISWEALIFIGIAMGLASVFETAGIQDWIVVAAGPAFTALSHNPHAFILGVAAITIVLRFLIVSEIAYLNIVMAFLVPLSLSVGMNPWVIGFAIYTVVSPWFGLYQTATYLAGYYAVDGQMARHADLAKYCAPYMLFNFIALAASIPYWQWMGLL